jgi:hypothetical protein
MTSSSGMIGRLTRDIGPTQQSPQKGDIKTENRNPERSPPLDCVGKSQMPRVLIACVVAFCLWTNGALALDPKIEAALREFKAVGSDPGRLKIFCAMSKALDAVDEREDAAAEAAIEGYLKALGPEFQKAWKVGEDIDENSPDGRAITAAIDELAGECD